MGIRPLLSCLSAAVFSQSLPVWFCFYRTVSIRVFPDSHVEMRLDSCCLSLYRLLKILCLAFLELLCPVQFETICGLHRPRLRRCRSWTRESWGAGPTLPVA